MRKVENLSPFRCRVWEGHGRMEEYLSEASCKDAIDSMRLHGQFLPVIGRRIPDDPLFEAEVICGSRRLFAARQLNMTLAVEFRELTDREAVIILDAENRQRKDFSPYERGRCFARWLATSCFASQDDIAHTLGISPSQVSRLLKIAKLPSVLVNAFADPLCICETWGIQLYAAWEDTKLRPKLAARARSISVKSNRPPAREVFAQLMAGTSASRRAARRRRHAGIPDHEVVTDDVGKPLFTIRHHDRNIVLLLNKAAVSASCLGHIKEALTGILQHASSQATESSEVFPLSSEVGVGDLVAGTGRAGMPFSHGTTNG